VSITGFVAGFVESDADAVANKNSIWIIKKMIAFFPLRP